MHFLIAWQLNRWQQARSARCLLKETRGSSVGLTTPRSSKPPFPDSFDTIVAEIEVSQRSAMRRRHLHTCKTLCFSIAYPITQMITAEIEVSQRCVLPLQKMGTLGNRDTGHWC